jgi:hypothetical protein
MGAARSSVWAKMSETKERTSDLGLRTSDLAVQPEGSVSAGRFELEIVRNIARGTNAVFDVGGPRSDV